MESQAIDKVIFWCHSDERSEEESYNLWDSSSNPNGFSVGMTYVYILCRHSAPQKGESNYLSNSSARIFFKTSASSVVRVIPLLILVWSSFQSLISYFASLSFQLTRFSSLVQPLALVERIPKFSTISYLIAVSYTHLTLPTIAAECRSRWSPYH